MNQNSIFNSCRDRIRWIGNEYSIVGMIGMHGLEYSIVGIEYLIVGMTGLGGSEFNIQLSK